MSKPTPTPWDMEYHPGDRHREENAYYSIDAEVLPGYSGVLVDTMNSHHCLTIEDQEANVRLMVAAPDLLAAAKKILSDHGSLSLSDEARAMAFHAVEKAQGSAARSVKSEECADLLDWIQDKLKVDSRGKVREAFVKLICLAAEGDFAKNELLKMRKIASGVPGMVWIKAKEAAGVGVAIVPMGGKT